jgi:DNA polymerase-3 subunit delta
MIFFLYGPDDFRAKEKIRELKRKFLREVDFSGSSLVELAGADLDLSALHGEVAANSLFARRRLVLIENLFLNKDQEFLASLAAYLTEQAGAQDNILIFYEPALVVIKGQAQLAVNDKVKPLTKAQLKLFAFLQATPYAQYFHSLNNQETADWLKAKAAGLGFSLDYKALQLLTVKLGNDLWSLNNEINKLISYQLATEPDNKIITAATVAALVPNQVEENVFALTDALSNKNKSLALQLLEDQLRQGINEVYLLTMLTRQIKILLAVRASLDNGVDAKTIGRVMKLHPYVLQKSLNQARNFNLAGLKTIFSALLKLDYNFKSGKLPAPLMMTLLLANI